MSPDCPQSRAKSIIFYSAGRFLYFGCRYQRLVLIFGSGLIQGFDPDIAVENFRTFRLDLQFAAC